MEKMQWTMREGKVDIIILPKSISNKHRTKGNKRTQNGLPKKGGSVQTESESEAE